MAIDLNKDVSAPLKSVKGEFMNTTKILTDRINKCMPKVLELNGGHAKIDEQRKVIEKTSDPQKLKILTDDIKAQADLTSRLSVEVDSIFIV